VSAAGPTARLRGLLSRPERLLPLACIAGALVLFASELMTTFEFTPPGGEPLCTQSAIDRHAFAPALLALFAIGATLVAILGGSKPAAMAVAICGVIALGIFLVLDLPHANNLGTLSESCGASTQPFTSAEAIPRAGFWLELVGSLALTISGAALASLTREQLVELRPGWLPTRGGDRSPAEEPAGSGRKPRYQR
jgi:hypothetical protein